MRRTEFKFTAQELRDERAWWEERAKEAGIEDMQQWPRTTCTKTGDPFVRNAAVISTADIHISVYHASDANWWQKFRGCLKGLPTESKLRLLYTYYHYNSTQREGWWCRKYYVRVVNYLDALHRGGFIDHKLRVVK